MLPRWQASAALTTAARDQRPTVSVVTTQRPDGAANLVLPGSTQAIQETAIYARTNGYVRKWYVDIGAPVKAGQLLAEGKQPRIMLEIPLGLPKTGVVIVGRLHSGVTLAQADAALQIVFQQALREPAGANPTAQQLQEIAHQRLSVSEAGRGYSPQRHSFGQSLTMPPVHDVMACRPKLSEPPPVCFHSVVAVISTSIRGDCPISKLTFS
jgi:multidrug efflux pump subunit AcrA (membrane-fusion protein)